MIEIEKITNRIKHEYLPSYENPIIKYFIETYDSYNKQHKYKLFNNYIFNPLKLIDIIKEKESLEEIYNNYLKTGKINFRNEKIINELNHFISTCMGMYKNKKGEYNYIFLYLCSRYNKGNKIKVCNGFSRSMSINDDKYLTNPVYVGSYKSDIKISFSNTDLVENLKELMN